MNVAARDLSAVYRDLHAHPELGFAEHRTAAIVAKCLRADGYDTTTGVGGTGVVGLLRRGEGPTVLLRADMDGLPVKEETGLSYASTFAVETSNGTRQPVMHACGHDMHVTALLGAAGVLARDASWRGTLMLVFQPAEEQGAGARAMIDDGLYVRFPRPSVVLGQHVAPLPAGTLGLRTGPAFAASDALRMTVYGRGGHGSRPETTVDPIVLAAAIVLKLQTIVSRELPAMAPAVVTVGTLHAGTAPNVIPDQAVLELSVRSFNENTRAQVLTAIERIARGEALAAGAEREPETTIIRKFPAVINDADASERTRAVLETIPGIIVIDPGSVTGSEDVGVLATAADAPCVYWLLGGADPALFADSKDLAQVERIILELPSNHSPHYAPVIEPTLSVGVVALCAAARAWLVTCDTKV